MRSKASTDKRRATELHGLIVRSLGRCELHDLPPGYCSGPLQCCHIIGRASSGTRTDLANAICGCQGHHSWIDSHIADKVWWVDLHRGEGEYRRLQAKADAYKDLPTTAMMFWREERARLTLEAKERGLV